jgi:hypothetical protein
MAKANGRLQFAMDGDLPILAQHDGGTLISISHELLDIEDSYAEWLDASAFKLAGCIFVYEGEDEDIPDASIYRVVTPSPN